MRRTTRFRRRVPDATLRAAVEGKVVAVTGASSGIGCATALRIARAGARVALVARTEDALEQVRGSILAEGGIATAHPCDISETGGCSELVAEVCDVHGRIDILINSAGRSIRRPVNESLQRVHDVERTMQLNYLGTVALVLASLEVMLPQRSGHIVNVSSIGTQWSPPLFAAYLGSKSALEAFSRCAASEVLDQGIAFSTVHMPLVRTPMIDASASEISRVPAWGADQAAEMICRALVTRQIRVTTVAGLCGEVMTAAAPQATLRFMSLTHKRADAFTGRRAGSGALAYATLLRDLLGTGRS